MAGFQTKTFLKHDDYMTPKSAWEYIKEFIPNDKLFWEAFYGDGKSGLERDIIWLKNKGRINYFLLGLIDKTISTLLSSSLSGFINWS